MNQRIECYLNNTMNLRPLAPHIMPCYTQNGDRIVAIDSVTSLDPMYTWSEVTSHNLWSRHNRHFVGITWHNVWS